MTGFDETVPPEADADRDEQAVAVQPPEPRTAAQIEDDEQDVMPEHNKPQHDSTAPAFEDGFDPDEMPPGQH